MKTARRRELRAQAHTLVPVVIIGDKGLTDEVLAEIDRSLKAHELIKIRAATGDRDARDLWMEKICERLDAHAIQHIGKILVVYRENPDVPEKIAVAEVEPVKRSGTDDPRKRKRAEQKRKEETATRTLRPRSRRLSPRPESEPRRRRRNTSQ